MQDELREPLGARHLGHGVYGQLVSRYVAVAQGLVLGDGELGRAQALPVAVAGADATHRRLAPGLLLADTAQQHPVLGLDHGPIGTAALDLHQEDAAERPAADVGEHGARDSILSPMRSGPAKRMTCSTWTDAASHSGGTCSRSRPM